MYRFGHPSDLRPHALISRCLGAQKLVKYARMGHKREGPSRHEFQEYLAALANGPRARESVRQANLLFSFAELKFRIGGGGHCAVCHAHVRHVLPVEVEHEDGTGKKFTCLCTRCLVAEKTTSRRVTLRVGSAAVVYTRPSKLSVSGEGGHGHHQHVRAVGGK